ncbi:MAG: aminoacyl-tRNA hydrolase [Beggiatoa sp. IS2]|nr:MAG: aminoacyl-tRNA hydrolase [Beggiatoa sp. IS2]
MVGLGNPGSRYAHTRHNAGFWLIDQFASQLGGKFRYEAKFHGEVCRLEPLPANFLPNIPEEGGQKGLWLLKPHTFMNRSGQSIASFISYYDIPVEKTLIVHDDLDLHTGVARFKQSGGHGGHKGLKDIIAHLNSHEFPRLRIGINQPPPDADVADYVLSPPTGDERITIQTAIDAALAVLPSLIAGEQDKAVQQLHTRKVDSVSTE